nr:PREDICTED: dr1-associated corepressor-like [Latimeria chalumnae]|eukprot:XP_014341994.1 PREDICTED: dr1-associated corepressor-like [Latimeria chalumnae]
MPGKKRKYNSRFPPARIKKMMQTDEEVGKVAAAVPVIISRALESFLKSLLIKSCHIAHSKNAKTMTPAHVKQCIQTEKQFEFLKCLVEQLSTLHQSHGNRHATSKQVPHRSRRAYEKDPNSNSHSTRNVGGQLQVFQEDNSQTESDEESELIICLEEEMS